MLHILLLAQCSRKSSQVLCSAALASSSPELYISQANRACDGQVIQEGRGGKKREEKEKVEDVEDER